MKHACALTDIEDGGCLGVDVDDTAVLLHRNGDRVVALQGLCPHQQAPLAEGAIGGGLVVCPYHHAVFELETGARRHGPGLGALRRHACRVENGQVRVGEPLREEPPAQGGDAPRIVVIGAGAAGLACVDHLRRLGHAGPLILIDRERDPLYERTMLSKDVLRGAAGRQDVHRVDVEELRQMDVTLRFGEEVMSIDADARRIRLGSGDAIDYDLCFAAPGAEARRPDLPGMDLCGVMTLRHAKDAEAILSEARRHRHCSVVGGGFIGIEAAASLAQSGVHVLLVVRGDAPGARLGPDIARMLAEKLREMGIDIISGAKPEAFLGDEGALAGIRLSTGEVIDTRLALLAVGETRCGQVAGPADDDGAVRVDASLRAAEHLWVGGDAAAREGARTRHWRAAEEEGRLAAADMLGHDRQAEALPFFWTQVGGPPGPMVGLHLVGRTDPDLDHVDTGEIAGNDFTRWHLDGDTVVGATGSGATDRTAAYHLVRLLRGRVGREELEAADWNPLALL